MKCYLDLNKNSGERPKGEFHLEKQSKMCHCHDNLALLPEVAKILKEKMKENTSRYAARSTRKSCSKKERPELEFPFLNICDPRLSK